MSKIFRQYASLEAFLTGLSALGYAYFFVIAKDITNSSLFLMLSGLFALKVMAFLYTKLRDIDKGFALLGLLFGGAGALGMLLHGGYDLANAINPPGSMSSTLPSQVDPRGLLSFGATGLAFLYISWLMEKDKYFPKNLSVLGFVSGALLLWIYVARLTVLDPTNPSLLYPVLLEGFLVSPLWYIWLGVVVNKEK